MQRERQHRLRDPARSNGSATTPLRRRPRELAFILDEDPELGEGLPPEVRRVAGEVLRAPVITGDGPGWEPPLLDPRRTYGLLLLDGLLGRRVRIGRAVSTELLACGDILRPWDEPCLWSLLPPTFEWRVFRPVRLAILDERVTRVIGQRPELMVAFSGRLMRRARYAEYLMTVGHFRQIEHRLLATLWHLASNWGSVTPTGVRMPFPLTHQALGEIVGARRPSVTSALRRLRQEGQVVREPRGGYLLTGDPKQLLESWR